MDELERIQNDGRVDARPLVREYVEGISSIHGKIRELVGPDLAMWERVLDETMEKFQAEFGKETSLVGLIIASEESDGRQIETISISKVSVERRRVLEKKNGALTNLHKSYASNEIINDDA